MYIAAHSRLRQADVTEIRLGQTIVLLPRPGCVWPVELASQRLDARRLSGVLYGFRQRPLAVAQLRSFWHCHHLMGGQLSDEALLRDFASAIDCHRIEALVLPRRHGAVSSVSAAATGEAGGGPTRAPPARSATAARTTIAPQPAVPVAQWDIRRRLAYVLPKAAEDVPGEALRGIILGLATPEGIAALALVIGLEVASHAAGGVGCFADAALVAVLWAMCGVSAFYAMIAFRDFLIHSMEARTDRDLDLAARNLADAAVLLGTGALTFLGGWVKAKTAAGRVGGGAAGAAEAAEDGGGSNPRANAPRRLSNASSRVGAGGTPAKSIQYDDAQLQAKFKHASDFGVSGSWNRSAAELYRNALQAHIDNPSTIAIEGSYRGEPVTHLFNPTTNLDVIRDADGSFLSGWKLNAQQAQNVLATGKLGGG